MVTWQLDPVLIQKKNVSAQICLIIACHPTMHIHNHDLSTYFALISCTNLKKKNKAYILVLYF